MSCAGCNAVSGPAHVLHDGTKVCTYCPEWMRECLARAMLTKWTLEQRREHPARLEKTRHGIEDARELRAVLSALHAKGVK